MISIGTSKVTSTIGQEGAKAISMELVVHHSSETISNGKVQVPLGVRKEKTTRREMTLSGVSSKVKTVVDGHMIRRRGIASGRRVRGARSSSGIRR